jgi:hypothetical protein
MTLGDSLHPLSFFQISFAVKSQIEYAIQMISISFKSKM